jgi:hypothetical protein
MRWLQMGAPGMAPYRHDSETEPSRHDRPGSPREPAMDPLTILLISLTTLVIANLATGRSKS